MGQNDSGIQNSPFDKAWPAPDVAGTGLNGIGGGMDAGSGENAIHQSPFDKAVAMPPPGTDCTPVPDFGGKPPYTINVDGSDGAGSQQPLDITGSRNTIDKK